MTLKIHEARLKMNCDKNHRYFSFMENILPNISTDDFFLLMEKCLEIKELNEQYECLQNELLNEIDFFNLLSVHHEMRSPWVIKNTQRNSHMEKIFLNNLPEKDKLQVITSNTSISDFFKKFYNQREDLIVYFMNHKTKKTAKKSILLQTCIINYNIFITTFIIPSFFGHFLDSKNVSLFIEAIGRGFDKQFEMYEEFHEKELHEFIKKFEKSFLYLVLRQFFFCPSFRMFCGDQFTGFYDFFASRQRKTDSQYSRIQRFFQLFLIEFNTPILGVGSLFHQLFCRILKNIKDDNYKKDLLITIIFFCIILPMVENPIAYGVLPVNHNYKPVSETVISQLKSYFYKLCKIEDNININQFEMVDMKVINSLVNTVLTEIPIDPELNENGQGMSLVMPFAAIDLLQNYEESIKDDSIFNSGLKQNSILKICLSNEDDIGEQNLNSNYNKTIDLLIKLAKCNLNSISSPRSKAIQIYFTRNPFNMHAILNECDSIINITINSISKRHRNIHFVKQTIEKCQKAIYLDNSKFINMIVESMMDDYLFSSELKQKKTQMIKESKCFSSFVMSYLTSFYQKNKMYHHIFREIAWRFHSKLMVHFPLSDFISEDLNQIDMKFLNQKIKVLKHLEANGLDEKVQQIINDKEVFNSAQTVILRSCLLENPLESGKQIILALNTVESIFTFVFGVQPEANQLLPLLANLLIISPLPTPLSLGIWIEHFLNDLMNDKQKWFSDESMRPLEHYFRFNDWMIDILKSIHE